MAMDAIFVIPTSRYSDQSKIVKDDIDWICRMIRLCRRALRTDGTSSSFILHRQIASRHPCAAYTEEPMRLVQLAVSEVQVWKRETAKEGSSGVRKHGSFR